MKKRTIILLGAVMLMAFFGTAQQNGKHLFILSGQSNMARLDPDISFIPAVQKEFGAENVIVVKDALGGKPIRLWYQNWKTPQGNLLEDKPYLYDSLMVKVNKATKNQKIKTVTFIWMQGERDAKEEYGEVYEASLMGLYNQLSEDLNRNDVNFVIGRLSDCDMDNAKFKHWTMIRDIQVRVAESSPRFDWINTDDLNDGVNAKGKEIKDDLHMSVEGYKIMGNRFAEKAIALIKKAQH